MTPTTFTLTLPLHANTPRARQVRVRAEVSRFGEHIIVHKVESLDWVVLSSSEFSTVYDEVVEAARLMVNLHDDMDKANPDPYLLSYQSLAGKLPRVAIQGTNLPHYPLWGDHLPCRTNTDMV